MQRTTMLPEDWWDLTAETSAGTPAGQDVAALRAEIDQLRRALAGRAVIDHARGMVMVLTPCSPGAARGLLVDVSWQRNVKLPDVAAALIAAWEGKPLSWPMQRALRRLHAADRECDSRPPDEPSGRGRP